MPESLILTNGQSPGDILMLTATVRDLHRSHPGRYLTDVRTPFPELWLNNPYITPIPRGRVVQMHYPFIHQSNEGSLHYIHGFRLDLENTLNIRIAPGPFWGDLYLSEQERCTPGPVERVTGYAGPYWVMNCGHKRDCEVKGWIPEYAQQVVDHFAGQIVFAQMGGTSANECHVPLKNVANMIGATSIRDLVRMVYFADGVIAPITFAMLLAAATPPRPGQPLRKPCVVTAGGREPVQWYGCGSGHTILHTIGALRCCDNGGCWKNDITPRGVADRVCVDPVAFNGRMVQRCMRDLVTPCDVIRAIERYYIGGALKL